MTEPPAKVLCACCQREWNENFFVYQDCAARHPLCFLCSVRWFTEDTGEASPTYRCIMCRTECSTVLMRARGGGVERYAVAQAVAHTQNTLRMLRKAMQQRISASVRHLAERCALPSCEPMVDWDIKDDAASAKRYALLQCGGCKEHYHATCAGFESIADFTSRTVAADWRCIKCKDRVNSREDARQRHRDDMRAIRDALRAAQGERPENGDSDHGTPSSGWDSDSDDDTPLRSDEDEDDDAGIETDEEERARIEDAARDEPPLDAFVDNSSEDAMSDGEYAHSETSDDETSDDETSDDESSADDTTPVDSEEEARRDAEVVVREAAEVGVHMGAAHGRGARTMHVPQALAAAESDDGNDEQWFEDVAAMRTVTGGTPPAVTGSLFATTEHLRVFCVHYNGRDDGDAAYRVEVNGYASTLGRALFARVSKVALGCACARLHHLVPEIPARPPDPDDERCADPAITDDEVLHLQEQVADVESDEDRVAVAAAFEGVFRSCFEHPHARRLHDLLWLVFSRLSKNI